MTAPSSLRSVATVLLVAVLSASCAAQEPVPAPVLVWEDGEPDAPIESDPWVRALREGLTAHAHASNTADFTDPAVSTRWSHSQLFRSMSWLQRDLLSGTPKVFLGPEPFTPLMVTPADDGTSAHVAGCLGPADTMPPSADDGLTWPDAVVFIVRLSVDGHRRIVGTLPRSERAVLPDGTELTPEYCEGVPLPRAVFDPAPDLEALAAKGRDDVLGPNPSPDASSRPATAVPSTTVAPSKQDPSPEGSDGAGPRLRPPSQLRTRAARSRRAG